MKACARIAYNFWRCFTFWLDGLRIVQPDDAIAEASCDSCEQVGVRKGKYCWKMLEVGLRIPSKMGHQAAG